MRFKNIFIVGLLLILIFINPVNQSDSQISKLPNITGNFFVALNKLVVYVTGFFSKIFEKIVDYA
jgi:hypothetical protein